ARPARIALTSQPCSDSPASNRSIRWYSKRARLFSAMVRSAWPAFALAFALSLGAFLLIPPLSPRSGGRKRLRLNAKHHAQCPGRPYGDPHVRPRQRRGCLPAAVRLVRAGADPGTGGGAHGRPARPGPGFAAYLVHHREHTRTARPDRHATA